MAGVFSLIIDQANGQASATYDSATGRITVSGSGVNNWFVFSGSSGLTGNDPQFAAPPLNSGLTTDNDMIIGKTSLSIYDDFTDYDIGLVAASGLSSGDLFINWNEGAGTDLQRACVVGNCDDGQPGDFDADLDVDGFDFLIWQRDLGDATNLTAWEDNFGTPTPASASLSGVPEPASVVLLAMAGLAMLGRRRS